MEFITQSQKEQLIQAISNKGVHTTTNDNIDKIISNINNISNGLNKKQSVVSPFRNVVVDGGYTKVFEHISIKITRTTKTLYFIRNYSTVYEEVNVYTIEFIGHGTVMLQNILFNGLTRHLDSVDRNGYHHEDYPPIVDGTPFRNYKYLIFERYRPWNAPFLYTASFTFNSELKIFVIESLRNIKRYLGDFGITQDNSDGYLYNITAYN